MSKRTILVFAVCVCLAPRGVALIAGKKLVKPVPDAIDDWTHYLYDPRGNVVSGDTVVGPPAGLQWVCGPRWGRHHEHMSSVSAMVSAGGRVFTILDEGNHDRPGHAGGG